jgi:hypothetical protein
MSESVTSRSILPRRRLLRGAVSGLAAVALGSLTRPVAARTYDGPNVIIVRFGGGVRRRETIEPEHTHSPFLAHELVPRGTLFPRMELAQIDSVVTSHGEGTLNIVTGRYDRYTDVDGRLFGARFEPQAPTLFEYLRKAFAVAQHETLMINGEDRPDEEFYNFSNHMAYSIDYGCSTLSLYRFMAHRATRRLAAGKLTDEEARELTAQLRKWETGDRRAVGRDGQGSELERFWDRWESYYGDNGLAAVRGDRLLTELAVQALKHLRPRLMMINYQDCDFVHWGNPAHYSRGIAIIDQGLRDIVAAIDTDGFYRGRTALVVVPDCGRDSNPFLNIPYQHHFGSRSAHEIFALIVGPGIAEGQRMDRVVDQSQIAATVGALMGFDTAVAEGEPLAEAFT